MKGYILYDFKYVTSHKGKTIEIVKKLIFTRSYGEGVVNKQITEDFYSNETNQYNTTMVDTCS